MPVYTLNPSHRRATKRKASGTPSLRERVSMRRNGLSEDGAVVSNPRAKTPTGMYILTLIHKGSDYAVKDATRADIKSGWAMTYEDALELGRERVAELRAQGFVNNLFDMSTYHEMKKRNPLSEDGAVVSNPTTAYNVYLGTKLIDTVFQSGKSDAEEVRRSLINHDGYDPRIRVVKARRSNPLSEDGAVVSNPRRAASARRHNPEPKHLVLMPHRDYVAFRTSDGRTGSEPNMGPGKSGPTMALLLNRLGVLTENGMSPNWTVEVIKQEPSVLDTYLEGRPANRRSNPLSEDGAVVSNPRTKVSKSKAKAKAKRGSKRSGGRTAAQSNAAKAMKLFHSGQASSLAEAWDIIRSGR